MENVSSASHLLLQKKIEKNVRFHYVQYEKLYYKMDHVKNVGLIQFQVQIKLQQSQTYRFKYAKHQTVFHEKEWCQMVHVKSVKITQK